MATHISCRAVKSATYNDRHNSEMRRIATLPNLSGPRVYQRLVERCARDVSDIMEVAAGILPRDVDVFLTGIGKHELRIDLAREITTEFLASTDLLPTPQWPISGIVYGRYFRVIIQLTVKRHSMTRSVFCLLNTGSPFTYLSPSTLQALGFNESLPESLHASVHGQQMTVHSSPQTSHFKDINVLGSDPLSREQCQLCVDYKLLTAELVHPASL